MIISLLVIGLIFSQLTQGIFFNPRNISQLARQTTIVGILAIGMMFVIVAGHIDLSVGSVMGFCGTVAAVLQVWYGWRTVPTIVVTILLGIIAGLWHGYWVAFRRVPAFIITLGGLLIFRGVKLGIGKSMSIAPMNTSFALLGQSYLPTTWGWIIAGVGLIATIFTIFQSRRSGKKYNADLNRGIVDLLKGTGISILIIFAVGYLNRYQGIPTPFLIMLILAVFFNFIAVHTIFGRNVYAIGGNLEASELSGIKTKFTTLAVFIVSSGLAAISGMILAARLNAATPAAGDTMELDAIAACVIGGTSMAGGVGKIPFVIIGALVMASLDNGMTLINMENYWQFIVKGLVLTLAVWVDRMSKNSSN
jgi:D-xylose transport system permease protein